MIETRLLELIDSCAVSTKWVHSEFVRGRKWKGERERRTDRERQRDFSGASVTGRSRVKTLKWL
eukprot:scaffold1112_cov195-Alexandrium_tamarense.AAC.2